MLKLFSFTCLLLCGSFAMQAQNLQPKYYPEFDDRWGYIDSRTGEAKIFWHFKTARPFRNGIATAEYEGKWGFFDSTGRIIVPFEFSEEYTYSNTDSTGTDNYTSTHGYYILKIKDGQFVHQSKGSKKVLFSSKDGNKGKLQAITTFNTDEGRQLLATAKGGHVQKQTAIEPQNLEPKYYADYNNKWGYVDSATGQERIFWHFETARPFHNHVAAARYQGKWGIFDESGYIIVPFMLDKEYSFKRADSEHTYFVNKDGDIIEISGNTFKHFTAGLSNSNYSSKSGKKGLLDRIVTFYKPEDGQLLADLKAAARQDMVNRLISGNPAPAPKPKKIWSLIEGGPITNNSADFKFREVKIAAYYQNSIMLMGIGTGYQAYSDVKRRTGNGQIIIGYDTLFEFRQIPVYFSAVLFPSRPDKAHPLLPYIKFDAGMVMSQYTVTSARKGSYGDGNMILNAGAGLKINPKRRTTGILLELGYKKLPFPSPGSKNQDYTYFNLGFLF